MKKFMCNLFLVGLLIFALVPVFSIGSAPMPTGNPGGKQGSLMAIGSAPMPTGKKPSPKKG